MPQSEATKAANLAEARALQAAGKPLEKRHESALARYNKKLENRKAGRKAGAEKAVKATVEKVQKLTPKAATPQTYDFEPKTFKGPQERTIKNFPNAINEDSTHHNVISEVADHLSDKLNDAPAHITRNIDNLVAKGYDSLEFSQVAHEKGDVAGAKEHMQKAANHFTMATSEMGNRGLLGNTADKIKNLVRATSNAYVSSTVPGTGAAPHESFVPPKKAKVRSAAIPKKTTDESLANSFDALPRETESFHPAVGRQITGQQHMNNAVIGMMEGRG